MSGITREEAKKCVGAGWSNLLDVIYDRLPPAVVVCQVKEKFGGLRFNVDEADEELYDFIGEMEVRSFGICEVCGAAGKEREGVWLKTLCTAHLRQADKVS